MLTGRYLEAQFRMDVANFADWQAQTEALNQRHGGFKSYQAGSYPLTAQPDSPMVTAFTFTWNDGFTRCLRVQALPDGRIQPLEPDYQSCH
jgi:hypothetical protein